MSVVLYPDLRVSECIFLGETAVNLAQVTGIEFDGAIAIVRLASYHAEYEHSDLGKTWFKVRDPRLVRLLRDYVERLAAPGFTRDQVHIPSD